MATTAGERNFCYLTEANCFPPGPVAYSADDRIALLDFACGYWDRVGLVVGDRGFVGPQWFKCLKAKRLLFIMRLLKHHLLTNRQGRRHVVADCNLQPGRCRRLAECQVDGVWGGAQVTALAGGEYLFPSGRQTPLT